MQFGVFSVGDITPDPTSGRVPTEHERIMAMVTIARKAEEVGLGGQAFIRAKGRRRNPRPARPGGRDDDPAHG